MDLKKKNFIIWIEVRNMGKKQLQFVVYAISFSKADPARNESIRM